MTSEEFKIGDRVYIAHTDSIGTIYSKGNSACVVLIEKAGIKKIYDYEVLKPIHPISDFSDSIDSLIQKLDRLEKIFGKKMTERLLSDKNFHTLSEKKKKRLFLEAKKKELKYGINKG